MTTRSKLVYVFAFVVVFAGWSGSAFAQFFGLPPFGTPIFNPPTTSPAGYTDLLLTEQVKVGHLYFQGTGKKPGFLAANGKLYSELCYADFSKIAALKTIDEHVETSKPWVLQRTIERGGGLSVALDDLAKLLGANLGIAIDVDASIKQTYVVKNVRTITLSDEGTELVLKSVGKACDDEIAKLRKQKVSVVLVVAAQRADEASQVNKASGGIKLPFFPIGPSVDDTTDVTYGETYISANLAPVGQSN